MDGCQILVVGGWGPAGGGWSRDILCSHNALFYFILTFLKVFWCKSLEKSHIYTENTISVTFVLSLWNSVVNWISAPKS